MGIVNLYRVEKIFFFLLNVGIYGYMYLYYIINCVCYDNIYIVCLDKY